MVLGQSPLEGVDVVDVAVRLLQLLLDLHVRRDLREARHGRQTQGFADLVVRADALVAAPLDIEGNQVLAKADAGHDLVEQLVADFVDGHRRPSA